MPSFVVRLCVVLLTIACAGSSYLHAAAPRVTNRTSVILNRDVLPAHQRGDSLKLITTLNSLTARMGDKQVQAIDAWLEQKKIPSVGTLLTTSRLNVIFRDGGRKLPKPTNRELLLLIPALQSITNQIYETSRSHPALDKDAALPANFDEYEELLWDIHVFHNQLDTATSTARYANQLSSLTRRINVDSLTDKQIEVIKTDFGQFSRQLAGIRADLRKREAQIRLQRFRFAEEQLKPSADFVDQLYAIQSIQVDANLLSNYLKNSPSPDPRRNPAEMALDLKTRAKDYVSSNKKLAGQSVSLFRGLHYWMRGRYGAGDAGRGMLKSPQAMKTPQGRFALFMPKEPPKATDPLGGDTRSPNFERRHHYHWCFEDREVEIDYHKRHELAYRYEAKTSYFY